MGDTFLNSNHCEQKYLDNEFILSITDDAWFLNVQGFIFVVAKARVCTSVCLDVEHIYFYDTLENCRPI